MQGKQVVVEPMQKESPALLGTAHSCRCRSTSGQVLDPQLKGAGDTGRREEGVRFDVWIRLTPCHTTRTLDRFDVCHLLRVGNQRSHPCVVRRRAAINIRCALRAVA
jgi:hypothetical protein